MKIQRLVCLTCGAVFAVQRNDSADATWYKSVAKYLGQGNARVETVNHPYGSLFGEKDISKCCGKKKHHTMRNLIAALMLVIVTSGTNAQSKGDSINLISIYDTKSIKLQPLGLYVGTWLKIKPMPSMDKTDSVIIYVDKKRLKWLNDSTAVTYKKLQ